MSDDQINDTRLNELINNLVDNQLIIVKFTAEWCGPCQGIKSLVEEQVAHILFNLKTKPILSGKQDGFTNGRDRTFHFGDMEHNIVGMISHLAAMLPVANGYALSYQLSEINNVALAFIGDGATSEGDFHEALNLASVWNLPVIFLIENSNLKILGPKLTV